MMQYTINLLEKLKSAGIWGSLINPVVII